MRMVQVSNLERAHIIRFRIRLYSPLPYTPTPKHHRRRMVKVNICNFLLRTYLVPNRIRCNKNSTQDNYLK